jgi:hypothetical protein
MSQALEIQTVETDGRGSDLHDHTSSPARTSVVLTEELVLLRHPTVQISIEARRPPEFKHIIKGRKRNQLGFP